MFANAIAMTFRNLSRHKLYTLINIAGLAVGLAAAILILLFVRDETGYEAWIPGADNIYRVETTFMIPGRGAMKSAHAPGPLQAALLKDFGAQISHAARLWLTRPTIDLGERQFTDVISYVDADFFSIFNFPMIAGQREAALKDNTSMIIDETTARKYFGDEDPLGKSLTVTWRKNIDVYKVVGVMKDLPRKTHLRIHMIALFDPARYTGQPWIAEQWTSNNMSQYFSLADGVDSASISGRMKEFVNANVTFNIPGLEKITPGDVVSFNILPIARIHLHSEAQSDASQVNFRMVMTFLAVAVLIMIIASINFMNLSTARSTERAREVSLRKVLGATRLQLAAQFLGETLLLTLIALLLAIALDALALPAYNAMIDKTLSLDVTRDPALLGGFLGLALIVGLLGGVYPAIYLSSFRPARVLKANQSSGGQGSGRLRSVLVIFQFAISTALIVATAVVYSQTHYARTIDAGFSTDHKLILSGLRREKVNPVAQALSQEIAKLPGVLSVARSSDSLPQNSDNNTLVERPGETLAGQGLDDLLVIETLTVGFNFFDTYEIKPLAGRLFSPDFARDTLPEGDLDKVEGDIEGNIIINRRALGLIGFNSAKEAIGQTLRVTVGRKKKAAMTIVGVIADLHTRSVYNEITPMMFFADDSGDTNYLTVHLKAEGMEATLAEIDRLWAAMVPDVPVSRSFVDANFDALYQVDEQRGIMFALFAGLAVLIACLGLFGLAAFAAERRTREIGLRKVMGASRASIVGLLIWQFARPVLISNLIAWPLAAYAMNDWLTGFEYRIDLSPAIFVGGTLVALTIAAATVGYHAWRTAGTKPAVALRYE